MTAASNVGQPTAGGKLFDKKRDAKPTCRELRTGWPRNAPVINIEAEQAAEVASLMYSGPGEQRDTRQITERHSDLVGNSAAGGKRAGKCELVSRTKASSRSNRGAGYLCRRPCR